MGPAFYQAPDIAAGVGFFQEPAIEFERLLVAAIKAVQAIRLKPAGDILSGFFIASLARAAPLVFVGGQSADVLHQAVCVYAGLCGCVQG